MGKPVDRFLPDAAREALEATGLPWAVERGTRHYKITLAGRLVGIFPAAGNETDLRPLKNQVAQIRRMARELGVVAPAKAPAKPKAAPAAAKAASLPKPPPSLRPAPVLRVVQPWTPGQPTPQLRGEPGWRGLFTRETAPGALPSGTRVVKVRGDGAERSGAWIGEHGTVLGSVMCPDRPARLYFVEWDKSPRVASATMGRKIEPLKENAMDWRNYAEAGAHDP